MTIINLTIETEKKLRKAFKKQSEEKDFTHWVRQQLKKVAEK